MTTLTNRALLVSLNISQWTARKLDRTETNAIAAKHGTSTSVARVNKSLLPMAAALDRVHKLSAVIRTEYYRKSLPWGQDNMRIIKSDEYLNFTAMIAGYKSDWQDAVREFIDTYPDAVEDAKTLLNTLYQPDDYPSVDELARRFRLDVAFFPVPTADDWRVSLSDSDMAALRESIEEQVLLSQRGAMEEAWARLGDVITKARAKLGDPDAIFRDSLIENIRDMCAILPSLNITDDPDLTAIGHEIMGTIGGIVPDVLRNKPDVREQVSSELDEIARKMGAFYGA